MTPFTLIKAGTFTSFRRPLQQRNAVANVVLKEKPPTSHPSCDRLVQLQGVSCGKVSQLRNALL
jgi:hypothetical protein